MRIQKRVKVLPWVKKFIEDLFKDPKEVLKMDVLGFVGSVLTLRSKWEFSVTSWGRTVKHNKDVGGEVGSDHLMFLGLDVLLDPMIQNKEFEGDCALIGLFAYFEKDHYHLRPK